jgi:hypothetical protein
MTEPNKRIIMPHHPLAEVFGFPTDNLTANADRYRANRLCPYNNRSPNCTKSSVESPIRVCSVFDSLGEVVITCPMRFREDWLIATDAAGFFFPPGATWTSITEVQLNDRVGKSAGNIDVVLLSYDSIGRITDYGSLEVQAVYISGNVRTPFDHYMEDPHGRHDMDWRKQRNYPRADYLSSSRKRLAPQLIFKGGILNTWSRKMAVALNKGFYHTLPQMDEVPREEADMAWFVYDLVLDPAHDRYLFQPYKTVYTKFEQALLKITRSEAGDETAFLGKLQAELNRKLNNANAPETITPDPSF